MTRNTIHSEIIIRAHRFCRDIRVARWWMGGDPLASAWFTALSVSFPRGEDFFIATLRAYRGDLPPRLAADVRAFIAQEANHAREHTLFNRLASEAGYDLTAIDARLLAFIAETSATSSFVNLVVTACLEHFTAIIAHDVLARPDTFTGVAPEVLALWQWHATEEIEHKAVAFDTWMYAARRLSRWRRWKIRCLIMLKVTALFVSHRTRDALELMAQDGVTGHTAKRQLRRYLWGRDGALRRLVPAWARWFRPGFHPWNGHDQARIQTAKIEAIA